MALLAAIILGLFVGFVFNRIVDDSGEAFALDLVVGAVGASAGRSLSVWMNLPGAGELNLVMICVALVSALVLLTARRAISGDRHRVPATRRSRRR